MTDAPILGIPASLLGPDRQRRSLFGGKPLQVFECELVCSLQDAGAEVLFFPLIDSHERARRLLDVVDGLLLPGGPDVDPSMYGESNEGYLWETEPERDACELLLVSAALERDQPIFGICRGAQLLNVALGGTLVRNLEGPLVHRDAEAYDINSHSVRLAPDSTLSRWYATEQLVVTSVHHQAVKRLGEGLEAVAWAEDGTIEAVEVPDRNVVAVQWHPEWLTHRAQKGPDRALACFVESLSGRA